MAISDQYREVVELIEMESSNTSIPLKPEVVDNSDLVTPRFYGVPHDTWRPNQKDAILYLRNLISNNDSRPLYLELPTGSGKSSIPTAMGSRNSVLVLVNSLALLDQYQDKYGFTIVKGMREYPCVNQQVVEYWKSKHNKVPTCADCKFEKMSDCPVVDNCPYLVAREKAFASEKMACTYPFAMLSKLAQIRPGMLFMDEGHMAAETILDLSTISFNEKFRYDFDLPMLPLIGYEDVISNQARGTLMTWLKDSMRILRNPPKGIFIEDESKWRTAYNKVYYAHYAVSDMGQDFFVTGKRDLEKEVYNLFGKRTEKPVAGIEIKYMSAHTIAERLYKKKSRTVIMSATIGEAAPLARELGTDQYLSKSYDHPVPIEKRPVFDLDFPRMTWENMKQTPMLGRLQAVQITKFIRNLDPEWRGLILTSSYAKAQTIKDYLMEQSDMKDRVYNPPKGKEGLTDRINAFIDDPKKGLIVIDPMQGWGHGIDLARDLARFVVVASVPFGNHQDPYEKARKKVAGAADYAWWKSYMHVPQACGRVSRGEQNEDGSFWYNVALLADGSALSNSAFRYYPKWFSDAIRPLP